MADPRAAQKCKYCPEAADRSLIWAEGRAYVPVCPAHEGKARSRIREQGDGVDDIVRCSTRPIAYRETREFRMLNALQPPPVYEDDDAEISFGIQGRGREMSALDEAPVAPIGRASAPRGATTRMRGKRSKDIMRVSDQPIRRKGTEIRKRTKGPIGYIGGKDIPDNVLQMLGTDWKTLRATRTSDNRLSLSIDGVKFSVTTKRG